MLAIAHNAGDDVRSAQLALQYQASVVEIDARLIDGRLRAAHSAPVSIVGEMAAQSPSISTVWPSASKAAAVNIDVKDSSAAFLQKLIAFLEAHENPDTVVIITSRSITALERVREDYPRAVRLLSLQSAEGLHGLLKNNDTLSLIDGISVKENVLDEASARALDEQHKLVFAWVVNDLATVNRLSDWGVDGVATDNLAIMQLLGSHAAQGAVQSLLTPSAPADAAEEDAPAG